MSLRKIDDEQLCRTYYIEPEYAADSRDGRDRRSLQGFTIVYAEQETSDGALERIEGEMAASLTPRVWQLLHADESLRRSIERPQSVCEDVNDSVTHLQRMRELRRRLKIRRSLGQDVG